MFLLTISMEGIKISIDVFIIYNNLAQHDKTNLIPAYVELNKRKLKCDNTKVISLSTVISIEVYVGLEAGYFWALYVKRYRQSQGSQWIIN